MSPWLRFNVSLFPFQVLTQTFLHLLMKIRPLGRVELALNLGEGGEQKSDGFKGGGGEVRPSDLLDHVTSPIPFRFNSKQRFWNCSKFHHSAVEFSIPIGQKIVSIVTRVSLLIGWSFV